MVDAQAPAYALSSLLGYAEGIGLLSPIDLCVTLPHEGHEEVVVHKHSRRRSRSLETLYRADDVYVVVPLPLCVTSS